MAEGARTSDGRTVEGDAVAVGVGVAPRVDLARAVARAADGGAGEHLETSAPGIHAAGAEGPGGGVAATAGRRAQRARQASAASQKRRSRVEASRFQPRWAHSAPPTASPA